MNELIDQKVKGSKDRNKLYNFIAFMIVTSIVFFTIFKLVYTKSTLDSPLLPDYTIYYMNATLLNFTVVLIGGIIPALYLRLKKRYAISTYFLLAFFILGLILKNVVNFYELFYSLGS